ncbi:hemolysin III family protein [Rheinheimera sp.]|uniref:PAQR family membrane homeostasis protein TrhA n=1 Tax=Rheinheimera sp. TaxID=1869214 RepID=UPI00307E588F
MQVSSYSKVEEISHSVSHGLGFAASVAGLVLLLQASGSDGWRLASALVFGLSLCLLYASSTCYHACQAAAWKRRLRKLDHCAIFILIAGTYTPFTLISLREYGGWWLFGVVWTLALLGVVLKLFTTGKLQKLSVAMYLLMGWLILVKLDTMLAQVSSDGLWWLLAGGLCYSLGVAFYVRKSMFMHHLIWHLFVLAGSACHFLAIYLYVI